MTRERERMESIERAKKCGLTEADALSLRRIALTLHRWFELECGDGNNYGSWAIERDEDSYTLCTQCGHKEFEITDRCVKCGDIAPLRRQADGLPYMVHHHFRHGEGKDTITRRRIADKETGARKRLDKLMLNYPQLKAWIQTDPRGGTIYLCKPEDATDSLYTRGVFIA